MEKKGSILVALIISILFFIGFILFTGTVIKKCSSVKAVQMSNDLYRDSLQIFRNNLNQQVAKTNVIKNEKVKLFLKVKSNDSLIRKLQSIVKSGKDVKVALYVANQTIISLKDSLDNSIVDTVYKDGLVYPTYSKDFEDKWVKGFVKLGIDSFRLDQKIRNEYDFKIGYESVGLFRKKEYCEITNLNPYTETKQMVVWHEKPVGNKVMRGCTIGLIAGWVFGQFIYIHRQ